MRTDPRHELIHEPVGDPAIPWKDTFYFSLVDPQSRIHVSMHMTVTAGRDIDTRVAVGANDGGRTVSLVRHEAGTHSEASIGNGLARIEPLNLSWDSGHRVRWVCDGPDFGFDLVVTGVHLAPFFDELFPDVNPTGQQGFSYSHTEQLVRAEGTFAWHGEAPREVRAEGWRDRGWGRRINELSVGTGYDLVGAILPDGSAFALSAMRNVEHGPDAPLPIYGFLTSDDELAVPAVGGIYYKDTQGYPTRLGLEFADGRRVDGEFVRHISALGLPFHDTDPEVFGIGIHASDYYSLLRDPEGREFAVFSNQGSGIRTNVTQDGRFFS